MGVKSQRGVLRNSDQDRNKQDGDRIKNKQDGDRNPQWNMHPVIQLVLELLCSALVSGTAHVVYCKLRQAT
jgi:hypothetical protein